METSNLKRIMLVLLLNFTLILFFLIIKNNLSAGSSRNEPVEIKIKVKNADGSGEGGIRVGAVIGRHTAFPFEIAGIDLTDNNAILTLPGVLPDGLDLRKNRGGQTVCGIALLLYKDLNKSKSFDRADRVIGTQDGYNYLYYFDKPQKGRVKQGYNIFLYQTASYTANLGRFTFKLNNAGI